MVAGSKDPDLVSAVFCSLSNTFSRPFCPGTPPRELPFPPPVSADPPLHATDHGVFVPFKLMFKDVSPIPIVQVSIDASLDPRKEYALGAALEELRSEGVLVISGGLTVSGAGYSIS